MMLLRAEQSGIRFDLDVAPELPEIVADKIALRQILINLISNAVKFTPDGGSVNVAVRMSGADFLILITDSGIGIAEKDLARSASRSSRPLRPMIALMKAPALASRS
jgi:signal transduction histidine kinase